MASGDQFLGLQFAESKYSSGTAHSALNPRRFHVHETMSGIFEIGIIARSHDANVDLEKIAGKAAGFKIHTGYEGATAPTRLWTGVVSHVEQVEAEVSEKGESTYFVRIVPDLWLLTQRVNYHVFQRRTLPEIVEHVLGDWKIKPKLVLDATKHVKHDFVVQYNETDLDFVCRILERAGISFYYAFPDGTDAVLTLSDDPSHGPLRAGKPKIPWVDNPSRAAEEEFVTHVHVAQGVRPGKFTIRELDFRKKLDFPYLSDVPPEAAPEDAYEQFRYLPGDSLRIDPKDGDKLSTPVADDKGKVRTSQIELDARAARALASARRTRREVVFQSNCVDLRPGLLFGIDRHPRRDLKDKQLLVIEYTLQGAQGDVWTFTGRAVFADKPYQPALKTPRPRIAGVQSAVVVGPPGKEIYTDEIGRVRVQLPWDREGTFDDNSSCWVRVSQPWAGSGYGMHLIPRVGHEVLIGYLEGDPDQPVVVGRVYNKINGVPYKLPDFKTRSTWRTDSSPHSGGFSEIMFEDKKGEERLYVQAELDLQKLVKREEVERIYEDRMLVVGKDHSSIVKTVDATLVGESYTLQMIKPPSEYDLKILKQEPPTVSPLPTTMEMVKKRVIFTTGKATVAFDDDNVVFEADGNINIKAAGGDAIFEGSHAYLNSKGPSAAPRPASITKLMTGNFTSKAGDKRDILNRFQETRFNNSYQALSPQDKKHFDALVVQAKSEQEVQFLKKALAAHHTVGEVQGFAGKIRGKSTDWMQDNLYLTLDSNGKGVQQQWQSSCNATTVEAMHGELDPIYALDVHDKNPNFGTVNDANAMTQNPRLATEQRNLLASPYAGAVPGLAGVPGVPTARNTQGAGRFSDDQFNALSGTTGVQVTTQLHPTSAQAMSAIDGGLAQGTPVPIIIGSSPTSYGHYVLVTGSTEGPPKAYSIHDPWDGVTVQRSAADMTNGNLNVAGWSTISGVEAPTVLP